MAIVLLTSVLLAVFGIIAALTIPLAGTVYSQNSSSVLEQAQKSLEANENKIEGKFSSQNFQANNLSLIKNVNGGY